MVVGRGSTQRRVVCVHSPSHIKTFLRVLLLCLLLSFILFLHRVRQFTSVFSAWHLTFVLILFSGKENKEMFSLSLILRDPGGCRVYFETHSLLARPLPRIGKLCRQQDSFIFFTSTASAYSMCQVAEIELNWTEQNWIGFKAERQTKRREKDEWIEERSGFRARTVRIRSGFWEETRDEGRETDGIFELRECSLYAKVTYSLIRRDSFKHCPISNDHMHQQINTTVSRSLQQSLYSFNFILRFSHSFVMFF